MSKNTNLSFLTDYITADITNGRIGINNASPTVAFDVTGVAKFSSTVTAGAQVAITTTSTTAALQITLPSNANATILQSTGSNSGYGWKLQQEEVSTGDFRIFRREASVDYQVLNLARSTGAATFSSSVSVNGASAISKLNVIDGFVSVGSSANLTTANTLLSGYGYIISGTTYGNVKITSSYNNGNNQAGLEFYTDNTGVATERMRITSAGQVGIGKTPRTGFGINLDVSGGIQLTNDSANISYLAFGQNSNPQLSYTYIGGDARSTGFINFFTNDTERMRITSGGNVYIGLTSSGTNKFAISAAGTVSDLYVTSSGGVGSYSLGTGIVYSNGGVLTSTSPSDSRLKTDIKDISYGLSDILKLKPVSYNWLNDSINQGIQFGFIAQDVQSVMPDAIKEFGDDIKYLGLEKDAIYATLVKAIQELSAEITLLKNK